MFLFNLMSLDDTEIETVATVVHRWCEQHKVPVNTERGQAAMKAAINRALSGEKSSEGLLDAISIEMRLQQFQPSLD